MYRFLTVASFFCFAYFFIRRSRRLPYPPGPKGKFLVGNVADVPTDLPWKGYAEMTKKHGSDIVYLNLAGQSLIILNSLSVAEELLEHRSAIYSSRPRMPMLCELMGWKFAFSTMKYGPTWRQHRKLVHQSFNPTSIAKFKPHVTKSAHTLMRNMLAKPEEFRSFVRQMLAETILLITYGIQIQSNGDPIVDLIEKAIDSATEAVMPGRFLVDAFPVLKYVPEWMPGAGFQRLAKEWKKTTIDMVDIPYQKVRNNILAGKSINCLVADGLKTEEGDADWEGVVKEVAGTMYSAGSDTSIAAVLTGILALTCYPEVLKKAQAEIDALVAPGELPDFNDRESLPYLSAFIREVLRWGPPSPVGLPHYLETDDTYNGYSLPAGSILLGNIWAMLHDETAYPDPFTFNPDRFLKDGKINPNIPSPEDVVFGFGRRVCPGKHFADLAVWMSLACTITLFDISKPVDEDGNVIDVVPEWSSSSISLPLPFKCRIRPRSEKAVTAIRRTEGYEYFNE